MWALFSIAASVFWGLTYVINEAIYEKISVITNLTITSFITFLVSLLIGLETKIFQKDMATVLEHEKLFLLLLAEAATLLIAEVFIGYSIAAKNATLSALIEISYPIFIAFFAFILLRRNDMTASAAVGGTFIFVGIFIISFFNR
jgi:drug/metabolite transporter (DMT)-like permease